MLEWTQPTRTGGHVAQAREQVEGSTSDDHGVADERSNASGLQSRRGAGASRHGVPKLTLAEAAEALLRMANGSK